MAYSAVQVQVMPLSPKADLEKIKKDIKSKITDLGGKISKIDENPVAFGLKALIVTLAWPENKESELLELELSKIKEVSSVKIIDFRRSFG